MLHITILEIILRGIPETILLFLGVYIFSYTEISFKNLILSSLLLTAPLYLIRLLPIQFGVHTFLNLLILILLSVYVNKISTVKAISASLISTIILFICDAASYLLIMLLFKNNLSNILQDPMLKILYSMPSLLLFSIIIFVAYKIINSKTNVVAKTEI